MVKIFKKQEVPKGQAAVYSEDYVVHYRIQNGQIWTTEEITYSTASKGRLKQIAAKWRRDIANKKVELISIKYQ